MPSIVLSVFSFGISFLTVNLIRQRFRQSLLDIPNERSSHTQPTPRGGGLGFIIAFAITSAIAMGNNYVHLFADVPLNLNLVIVWLILIPLAIVGIIDDRSNVPAGIRYLVQLAAAGVVTLAVAQRHSQAHRSKRACKCSRYRTDCGEEP